MNPGCCQMTQNHKLPQSCDDHVCLVPSVSRVLRVRVGWWRYGWYVSPRRAPVSPPLHDGGPSACGQFGVRPKGVGFEVWALESVEDRREDEVEQLYNRTGVDNMKST